MTNSKEATIIVEAQSTTHTEQYFCKLVGKALVDEQKVATYMEYVRSTYGEEWWLELLGCTEDVLVPNIQEVYQSIV